MNARELVTEHILFDATDRVKALFEKGLLIPEKNFDGKFNCKRALREDGWKWDESGCFYYNELRSDSSFEEFDRDLCENLGLIPDEHFSFPLEYHAVSAELADDLVNRRETVLVPEGSGDAYWGRMTTGKPVHLDPVIRSIADLKDVLEATLVDDAEDTDLDAEEEVVVPVDEPEEHELPPAEDGEDDEDEDEGDKID